MTWATERSLAAAPILASWDESAAPIAWPGIDFDPPSFTGDSAAPAKWIDWDIAIGVTRAASYTLRDVPGEIDVATYVEPVGVTTDLMHRTLLDDLETAYTGQDVADTIYFLVQWARPTTGVFRDGEWSRQDWVLPFRRFE